MEFARRRGYKNKESSEFWEETVWPWFDRKLQGDELLGRHGRKLPFFEITVANARTSFPLNGGEHHYPAYGVIDEIDIERKRIVERTIKDSRTDSPPLLKDLEVWLYWRILSSLKNSELPAEWRACDFSDFDLYVETPSRDFPVPKTNPEFDRNVHWAFTWISDIGLSEDPNVIWEAYQNQACTPQSPHAECFHVGRNCFHRRYPFPVSRPSMQQVFKPWYRYLLWERLWESDLWWYRTTLLTKEQLLERALVTEARISGRDGQQLELEVEGSQGLRAGGFDRYTLVLFGNLHCGKRVESKYEGIADGHILMTVNEEDSEATDHALLFAHSEETNPLLQPPPEFLIASQQRGLFRLQKSGVIKPELAAKRSMVQLLESVFGTRRLRGRRP